MPMQAKIGGRQKKPRKRAEEEDGEEGQSQASERSRKAHRTAAADSPAPCNTRLENAPQHGQPCRSVIVLCQLTATLLTPSSLCLH